MQDEKKFYGTLGVDKDAKRMNDCRDIVRSIVQFGVDDQQILTIIRLLALEMEDHEAHVRIVELLKDIGNSCFLIERTDIDGQKSQ